MIAINHFLYNGYSSKDFDVLVDVAFDSDSGEMSAYLNRESVASESYNGTLKRVSNYKYSEVYSPKFTLVKEDFSDFTMQEQRKILSWLTSSSTPKFLTAYYDDSEVVSFEILGAPTEINTYKIANGRTVGITFTYESVTPYALSALQTITKDVSSPSDNTIIINLETDDPENAVFPKVTIQQKNTIVVNVNRKMIDNNKWIVEDWLDGTVYYYDAIGEYYYNDHREDGSVVPTATTIKPTSIETTSVLITNTHTDIYGNTNIITTKIINNIGGETVTLDGANKVISSSNTTRIFDEDFYGSFNDSFVHWNWLPLYKGKNEIKVVGNCTLTISYRYPIKCGEY